MFSASSLARDFSLDRATSSSLIRNSTIGRSSITVRLARHPGLGFRYRQVIVLSRKAGSRLRLRNIDRLILVWMCRLFPSILNAITVIKPETVIRWHRRGFRAQVFTRDIAAQEGVNERFVRRLIPLAFLSPAIVQVMRKVAIRLISQERRSPAASIFP